MNLYYKFYRFKKFFSSMPKRIKYSIQRLRYGFSDEDVYSLDTYLARIITDSVMKLRDNKIGYPTNVKSHAEWMKILLKIANGFKAYTNFEDVSDYMTHKKYLNEYKKSQKMLKESLKLFSKHFCSLWD